ncbi:MAG TPA: hypothetical protein VKP65_25825 [Rhodothermales bacterium]|nr:hypothetical protein [Rhodothermales bacterium]
MLRPIFIGMIVLLFTLLVGCDLFASRTPADPISEGGTFVQPDAPDLVVDNLQAAIAELNTANYRRSLAEDLAFQPTATAEASDPSLWGGWSKTEEVSAFTTIAEAARLSNGHLLRLEDQSIEVGDTRYTLDATYVLVVRHSRADVPDTLQGRLIWEIAQGNDGLWSLQRWTDRELGNSPSWSDLKAGFAK